MLKLNIMQILTMQETHMTNDPFLSSYICWQKPNYSKEQEIKYGGKIKLSS